MAEYTPTGGKAELIEEIERARMRLSHGMEGLRQDADIGAHLTRSFAEHKAVWLGGAGLMGWVISRLPARRKKVKLLGDRKKEEGQVKHIAEAGLLLGILKFVFSLFRPAIVAFATKKIAALAAGNDRRQK